MPQHQSLTMKHGDIYFTVDYYTELLGVMGILSDRQYDICEMGLERCQKQYRDEILSRFSRYKNHKAVHLLELFSDKYDFNYDAPVELALRIGRGADIDKDELCRGRKPIDSGLFDEFIDAFNDFDKTSGFEEFYKAHIEYYRESIENFISDYDKYKPLDWLLEALAVPTGFDFSINLMHGITNANYAALLEDGIVINIRPYFKTRYEHMPDFSYSSVYWTTLVVHEFAHGLINPLTRRHSHLISNIDKRPYEQLLKELCYGTSLETYINETLIRSLECLYVKENFKELYEQFIDDYREEGYDKIPRIIELTKKKESFRLESYIDEIIEIFQNNLKNL